MSYLPLARKWRPQTFADVISQEPVTTTLANAISRQRVAQAYLFAGPRGVGKTSTARIFAKCLNCAKGPTATPCQQCPSCTAITQGSSLDVLEIDGASNRGIDQIRELRENVKFLPTLGRYKIYIIDEVHQITADGFNALLKTLEEPPPHVVFIFATTHPDKVLPTILSRCQRFDFRRVPVRELVTTLQRVAKQEKITVDEAALFAIARAADGSVRDAESLLDQLANFSNGAITAEVVHELLGLVEQPGLLAIIEAVLQRDAATALRGLDALLQRGKDVSQVSAGLTETVRHALVVSTLTPAGAASSALPWAEIERLVELPRPAIEEIARVAALATAEDLLYMLQLLARTQDVIKRSQHGRVHVELLLTKLATRADFTHLSSLLTADDSAASPAAVRVPAASAAPAARPAPTPVPSAAPKVVAVAPKAPAPAPSPVRAPAAADVSPAAVETLAEVERVWSDVLADIGRQRMSVASCLAEGKPLGLDGDRLTIGVPDVSLHRELFESADHRRLIERVAAARLGRPRLTIAFKAMAMATVPTAAPVHPEPPASDLVQSALKMFNARVVGGGS